jgi:hypothetical protein
MNHLDPEKWAQVDDVFERKCGHLALYEPLKEFTATAPIHTHVAPLAKL